jgi:hypothetical protein
MKLRTVRRVLDQKNSERDSLIDANNRLQQTVKQQGATIRDLQTSLRIERERASSLDKEVDRLRQLLTTKKAKGKNINLSIACPACGHSARFLFEPTDDTPPDGLGPVCEILARAVHNEHHANTTAAPCFEPSTGATGH